MQLCAFDIVFFFVVILVVVGEGKAEEKNAHQIYLLDCVGRANKKYISFFFLVLDFYFFSILPHKPISQRPSIMERATPFTVSHCLPSHNQQTS